jgi:hypothetical protein
MTHTKIDGNKKVLRVLFAEYTDKDIDLEWAK